MNSKKIVSSLVFAAVFSAALVSNASAADPRRWRRRKRIGAAIGGIGLIGTVYSNRETISSGIKNSMYVMRHPVEVWNSFWNIEEAADAQTPDPLRSHVENKDLCLLQISKCLTNGAPCSFIHGDFGSRTVLVLVGCSEDVFRGSEAEAQALNLLDSCKPLYHEESGFSEIFNDFTTCKNEYGDLQPSIPGFELGNDGHISWVLGSFVQEYTKTAEIPIQVLIIDRATGKAHFGACHSWCVLGGISFEQEKYEVEIEGAEEPRYCQYASFDLSQVPAGKIVLCGPSIQGLERLHYLAGTHLLQVAVPGEGDTPPAENLIEFVLKHSSAQDCPGFAAIVVDLSSDGNGYGDGVIGGNGTSETGNDAHHAGQDSSGSSAVEVGHLPNEEDSGEGVGVDVSWLEETNGVAGNGGGNGSSPLKVNPSWASEHPQGGAIASTAAHSGAQAVAHEVSHGADEGTAEKEHSGESDGASANGSGAQPGEAIGIDDVDEPSTRALYIAGDCGDDDAFERGDGYLDEHNKGRGCLERCRREGWRRCFGDGVDVPDRSQGEYDTFEIEGS